MAREEKRTDDAGYAAPKTSPELAAAFREYVTEAVKRGDLSEEGLQALMLKYGADPLTNAGVVIDHYKKYGTANPDLITKYRDDPTKDIAPSSFYPTRPRDLVGGTDAGGFGNAARAVAKGAAFDFNDEIEAAARTLVSGNIGSDEYYKQKNRINTDYETWARENPALSTGLEVGGGVASAFIPGVGVIGRGAQAATRIGRIANTTGRAAATGALSGAVSGVGRANTWSDVPANIAIDAGAGAALGALLPVVGTAGLRGYQRLAGKAPQDAAERRAAEIVTTALGGESPRSAAARTRLSRRYGTEATFGEATPGLALQTEAVMSRPSAGQSGLVRQTVEAQSRAPTRVGDAAIASMPDATDYFAAEDVISANLKSIGNTAYKKAHAFGEVADKQIQDMLEASPALGRAFAGAVEDNKELRATALGEGRDASEYALTSIFEPVFDKAGLLTGHRLTGNRPDVRTLDAVKQSLDRQIDTLYKTGKGGEATILRGTRNALVKRLDEVVPDYKAARSQYAGELEVRDALRAGREDFMKLAPQQVDALVKGMSVAEKEAFRSGVLQKLLEPIQNTKTSRNFAHEIINVPATRAKLQTVLSPREFSVMDATLSREAALFKTRSKMLGGSRTAPLGKEMDTIDEMIAGEHLADAANLVANFGPGTLLQWGAKLLGLVKNKGFEDKVYTHLSKIMKSGTPAELVDTLAMFQRHAAAAAQKQAVDAKMSGLAASALGRQAGAPLAQDTYAKPARPSNVGQTLDPTLDEAEAIGHAAQDRIRAFDGGAEEPPALVPVPIEDPLLQEEP